MKKYIIIILGLALMLTVPAVQAAEYFISVDGSDDTGDGSEGNPYASFGMVFEYVDYQDTVTVMPGTYEIGWQYLFNSVTVRSQWGPDTTTLSGFVDGKFLTVLYTDYLSGDVTIEGFTFSGANRAIQIDGNNSIVRNCTFLGNFADSSGAAIYVIDGQPEIYSNYFKRNFSEYTGGAIFSYVSGIQCYNNIFDSCIVVDTFGTGGAIAVNWHYGDVGPSTIQNNIFRYCKANNGAGIYLVGGQINIYNNLFHNCTAQNVGAGIYVSYDYAPRIYNNIFMNNTPDGMYNSGTTLSEYDNNNYYNNTPTNGCINCPAASHIYTLNPIFQGFQEGDYHFKDNSGLIDKGASNLPDMFPVDFDGDDRWLSQAVDIGPDEYVDCSISGQFTTTDDTAGCPPLTVQFIAVNMEGYYDSLVWDFGDGYKDYNTQAPQHNYSQVGDFDVTLTLITPCTTYVYKRVNYIHAMNKPIPNFTSDAQVGCIPFEVTFDGSPATAAEHYAWDFGDGETSAEMSPVHNYESAGVFTVRLTVSNSCGQDSIIRSGYIEVLALAEADFTSEVTEGSAPLNVNFVDLSENDPITWSWDFGDGGVAATADPLHRFLKPGIFDVRLICANECGNPDTIIKQDYVTVYGFESELYDTRSISRYVTDYDFYLDSLYGLFVNDIRLTAEVYNNPTRGSITLAFDDSTVQLFDSTTLTTTLSKDVPRGDYTINLIGKGTTGYPADTLQLTVTSTSDPLILVSPSVLNFGQVPEDSVKNINLRITNNGFFGDVLKLTVSGISSSIPEVTTTYTNQFTLDPTFWRDITVSFAPPEIAEYSGVLTIISDDPAFPSLEIPISGQGIIERTPPVVDSTAPLADAKQFPVVQPIIIEFSEALDEQTVIADNISVISGKSGSAIEGSLSYNSELYQIIFTPTAGFAAEDSIVVTVSGALLDLAGNSLDGNDDGVGEGSPVDDYTFSFTTGLAVYPGDANNDGIVNEMDILPLGVYWEITGDARNALVTWTRQPSVSWTPKRATYADCNGDGIVNEQDMLVIGTHWGLSHQIEGVPTVFTLDELQASSFKFDQLDKFINYSDMGETGSKFKDIISAYLSTPGEIESFTLGRNFPNPFNPITTIDFTLPRTCHVRLEVYNVLGQTVKLLINEQMDSGLKTVVWDGTDDAGNDVPSGVYFYRMTADEFNEVKKMLLIR